MGYSTTGSEGTLVSLGSANFYSVLRAGISVYSCVLTEQAELPDTTPLDQEYDSSIVGLKQFSLSIKARAFSTPRLGNVGTVVFSSGGYALHVESWTWKAETLVHDITELAAVPASGPIWMSFRPDGVSVTGTINARADSATALVGPHATTPGQPSAPTLTLLYGDSATDEQISGTAWLRQLGASVTRGSVNTAAYEFTGAGQWTPAGTNSPIGSTALATPLWNQGGAAVAPFVFATLTGSRTFTAADSFWKSIEIRCNRGQPVEIDIELQGTGAPTGWA